MIEKPNRTCLSDINNSNELTFGNQKKTSCRIVPSQNILFELAQHRPDITRWTTTFVNDETEVRLSRIEGRK